jgi:hypothetical protein
MTSIDDVSSALGSLPSVCVGSVVDVSGLHAASHFYPEDGGSWTSETSAVLPHMVRPGRFGLDVTLSTRVWEVVDSNPGRVIGSPEKVSVVFLSP